MPRSTGLTSATAVQNAFYSALAHADIQGLMALWADDEEVICVHPGGPRLIGYHAIRQSFEGIFGNGPIRIQLADVHAYESASLSVHHLIERIRVIDDKGGVSQIVEVPATNIFIKNGSGWQLLIHHASPGSAASLANDIDLAESTGDASSGQTLFGSTPGTLH